MRQRFLTPSGIALTGRVVRRFFCVDAGLAHYLTGALDELTSESNWEPFGDMNAQQMVEIFEEVIGNMGNCDRIGEVFATVGNVPDYCLLMDGTAVLVADYPDLALVVPQWVSGASISIPNMDSAYLVGGVSNIGIFRGENTHTLTEAEMPSHTHGYTMAVASVTTVVVPDEPSAVPAGGVTGASGGNQPHNNMPYSLVVKWAIVAK